MRLLLRGTLPPQHLFPLRKHHTYKLCIYKCTSYTYSDATVELYSTLTHVFILYIHTQFLSIYFNKTTTVRGGAAATGAQRAACRAHRLPRHTCPPITYARLETTGCWVLSPHIAFHYVNRMTPSHRQRGAR